MSETKCIATEHPDGLWACGCEECRQLQREADNQTDLADARCADAKQFDGGAN